MALTALSLYILLFADDHSSRRRGAIILLATTVPMLWSRMLFNFFANFMLEIDASLVGWALGTDRVGNMVRFADDTGYLVVFPSCSSVANMSLAFLCWITISVSLRHRWSPQDLLWGFFACASVVTVNVTRMSLMGLSQEHFEAIHSQWGDAIANVIMLGLSVGFSVLGVRREIFGRA
jgi:exosortase/archaeosortase family protein